MVEGKALFEWSPEVAIALGTRFCSWVVAEEDDEQLDMTEDSRSVGGPRRNSKFGALGNKRPSLVSASNSGSRPANDQGEFDDPEVEELPMFGGGAAGITISKLEREESDGD